MIDSWRAQRLSRNLPFSTVEAGARTVRRFPGGDGLVPVGVAAGGSWSARDAALKANPAHDPRRQHHTNTQHDEYASQPLASVVVVFPAELPSETDGAGNPSRVQGLDTAAGG